MSLLDGLIELICLPYRLWKESIESSGVGASEEDLKALRFWKWVAWVGVSVVVIGVLAVVLFWKHLTR